MASSIVIADAHITHLEKHGPLIKIYAQIDKHNALFVERLLYQLHETLEGNSDLKPKTLNDLPIGEICCAKFDDNSYYRAKILNLDNLGEYKITLLFIDHGNVAQIRVTEIRLLSKLQTVINDKRVESLIELSPLAEEFYLAEVIAREQEWDDASIELLKKKLCNSDANCIIYDIEGKRFIKINRGVTDPVSLLVNMNKGIPCPIQTQALHFKRHVVQEKRVSLPSTLSHSINTSYPPPNLLVQRQSLTQLPNFSEPPPVRIPHSQVKGISIPQPGINKISASSIRPPMPGIPLRRPELQQTLPPVHNLQFSTEMLAPGVSHLVYVSHVEDGPYSFAVQLQSVVNDVLMKMMTELNSIKPQPIIAPLNPGSICLARTFDNSICRAIVMNVFDDKVKLYFADFGNSEIVPFSDIYQIPPQFVTPKVMSHRFTLANIKDVVYTEHEKKLFKDLVANQSQIMIKVTQPEANPLKQYCELFINCKNVKIILAELAQSQPLLRYVPVPTPHKGSQEKVFVSFVLNPGRFFVQLEKNILALNQVMNHVASHCRTAPHVPLVNIRPGEPCCALFEDDCWYRAEIIKLNPDNKAFIHFVDFGNQEDVELANLRQTTPELVNSLKAQAIVCCLRGYELRYDVEEEVSNRLEELILEKKLIMHILGSTDNNVLIVQLVDLQGKDIGDQLGVTSAQSPEYNSYQASSKQTYKSPSPAISKPAYTSPPTFTKPSSDDGFEETATQAAAYNSREDRKYTDSRGPSDDTRKSWRSREDGGDSASRFNREGSRRFNRDGDDSRGSRFSNEESRFNRDEGRKFGDRSGRFSEDDSSDQFSREDTGSRGGRGGRSSNRGSESRGRYSSDRGGSNSDRGGFSSNRGGFNSDRGGFSSDRGGFSSDRGGFSSDRGGHRGGFSSDRGGRFSREDGGGRFTRNDEDKPWNKKDEESGSWKNKDDDSGSWKGKRNDKESSGGWNKDRDSTGGRRRDGGGDFTNKFDSDRRGGFNKDRSSFSKPWEKGGGDGFAKPSTKTHKPDAVGGMPPSTVKVGQTESAEVCYTTSPTDFYVQLSSTYEELNQLMEKIATACESNTVSDMTFVQEKSGCLARYSEDDSWYRAVVIEKSFDSVKVLFVDYGNEENVPLDKIKNLPEDMCTLPVQGIKCRLLGVSESADTEAFKALVEGKPLKTIFVSKHFLSKSFEVVLIDEETNSNINVVMGAPEEQLQTVLSKVGSTVLTPISYPLQTSFTTQMTWYLNPSQFYLKPMASNEEFRAMMQAMQAIVRTGTVKQNNQLNVGDFVIARFKMDKVLYRALVQEAGFAPKVHYVDYGNSEAVDSGSVWAMEPEFATLPIQAFSCCLAGVQPVGDAWPKAESTDLDSYFEADTLECCVIQEVEEANKSRYVVQLSKQGEDIAQKIIEAGFAVAGSDAVGVPSELDTSLLVGQPLPVKLVRIEDDLTFYVQPATEDIELQSLESEPGQGVKCIFSNLKEDATTEEQEAFKQLPPNSYIIILVVAVQTDGLQVILYDGEGKLFPLQASDTLEIERVCPLPVLNTHQRVYIAHASDDGIFLHKTVFADMLGELLQKLFEFYDQSEPVEQEWKVGDLCCAKSSSDEQWYRGRILEYGEEAKVQYIDYGNIETIPTADLRQLDASFYIPYSLALHVTMHVAWSVPIENLMELTQETEYSAVVLRNDNGWVVELVDDSGNSLTEKLSELGFAVPLENSPFKRVVEGGRFVEGSDIPISVSFIDSPLQIWIFVGDDIELIEALQDRLQEAAHKLPSLKDGSPTGIFAAKFSDGLWYRAVKLDESIVRFIDYGNSDKVDMTDIKALSADFLEPAEGYAVKVELPVVDIREGAKEKLEELLISSEIDSEEDVIAHILSVKENSIVADILKGGKSVIDILAEENLGTRLQRVYSGFVSHFNSLNDFFVQEVGCEENLDAMVQALSTAENFEPISQLSVGDIVAALYPEDGAWYRAKVITQSDDSNEVLFIDYGNSALATDFRILPPELISKSALANHCALLLPNGVESWSDSANEKFMEISAEGCTQFDIKVVSQGNPADVILFNNDNCVNDELKVLCDVTEAETIKTESASTDLTDYDKVVYITHINDVTDFFVQLDGAELELESLQAELADVSSFQVIEEITDEDVGKILGAFSDIDDIWHRAKILKLTEDGADVLYVDYGKSSSAKKFVKLPQDLENKIPVALHCSLVKEENIARWPEEASKHLSELSAEGTVPFNFKLLEKSGPNIVSLVYEGQVVEKELERLFINHSDQQESNEGDHVIPSQIEKETTPDDENFIKPVFLIKVNSPSDFFLHTAEATQLLGDISEKLTAAEEFSLVDESSVCKGKIVAAQIDEDDLWFRAKIIDHSVNETKVIFIDYGNYANVAKMRELPEDLASIPALAMHCTLEKPGEVEWSLTTIETFNKLANEEGVSFNLKIISKGEPNLVSLYINGESITEQLILSSGLVTEEPSQVIDHDNKDNSEGEYFSEKVVGESANPQNVITEAAINCQTEIENMIMQSFENKITEDTSSHVNQIIDTLISNAAAHHQTEMKNVIMESVENEITKNTYNDMQQIMDTLVSNALNLTDNEKLMPETQVDLHEMLNIEELNTSDLASSQISDHEKLFSENQELSISQNECEKKVMHETKDIIEGNSLNTTAEISEGETKEREEIKKDVNSYNRTDSSTTEEKCETLAIDESSKTLCNGSPSTPRRSNIDEHIVPGCISNMTLEDSADVQ